ncbi:DUF1003 domain-containing protein [Stenotrophomonas rhizophila]|uniref:Membrane protein n=1 Tax=Stenotrophomonas rhizophila TaxID=216778 RepID=A0AAW5PCW1_9GAMM|nr:DUF1003 domain-containing protein [Stenotrophomonas rhizophila]MCS4278239.1 putative membrane protein [Stenotrophomonas rhizophila]
MASYDYEVNLKAELEIMALHEEVDTVSNQVLLQVLLQSCNSSICRSPC